MMRLTIPRRGSRARPAALGDEQDGPIVLLDRILVGSALTLGGLSLLALIWLAMRLQLVRLLRRRQRSNRPSPMFCPTSNGVWWFNLLLPHRFFFWNTCGYDLSGQGSVDESGEVRCPECGSLHRTDRVHRCRFRVRPGRVSLACLFSSASCLIGLSVLHDDWVRYTPTFALIAIQEAGVPWQESSRRRELVARVRTGGEPKWVTSTLARYLANDLRGDDKVWNANEAMDELWRLGRAARPALLEAVRSTDWQQRQYALVVLVWIEAESGAAQADPGAVSAAIEALLDDNESYFHNAVAGYSYLFRHGRTEAEVRLAILQTLRTASDPQQQLLCALLCGQLGCIEGFDLACPILLDCLKDNDVPGDAKAAAVALCAFGPAVAPLLRTTLAESTDAQQVELIELMLFDLREGHIAANRPPARLGWQFNSSFIDANAFPVCQGGDAFWLRDYVAARRRR